MTTAKESCRSVIGKVGHCLWSPVHSGSHLISHETGKRSKDYVQSVTDPIDKEVGKTSLVHIHHKAWFVSYMLPNKIEILKSMPKSYA